MNAGLGDELRDALAELERLREKVNGFQRLQAEALADRDRAIGLVDRAQAEIATFIATENRLQLANSEQETIIRDLLLMIEAERVPPGLQSEGAFDFLSAMLDLTRIKYTNRRRYCSQVCDLSFLLHRYSPEAYELLRQYLPLPARSTLQERFGPILRERILDMTDITRLEERVRRHFEEHHIPMAGQQVILALDATGISDNGADGGAGYCFAFGMLFVDPAIPDVWLHVTSAQTGAHGQAALLQNQILEILRSLGLRVRFLATDGDHGLDGLHHSAFRTYWDPRRVTLSDIFDTFSVNLDVIFDAFPVSDLLHLFKTAKQRVRNSVVAAGDGKPGFDGGDVSWLLGGLPSIATPGRQHAQSDAEALRAFRLDVVLMCIELDDRDSGVYFAPWALLHVAVAAENMTLAARLQALEIAFAMFGAEYILLDEATGPADLRQRKTSGKRLTFADANQLRRAMNDCLAFFVTLKVGGDSVNMGRVGTHSVEKHFGIIMAALRGVSQWRSWVSAEAFACLVPGMRRALGLARSQPRRSRAASTGAVTHPDAPGDVDAFQPERMRELIESAYRFVRGERADLVIEYIAYLVTELDIDEPAAAGPFEGVGAQFRQGLH
jgi:hypothetical protein